MRPAVDFDACRKFAMPNQSPGEWRLFLEFCEAYFRNRSVVLPVVVELGLQSNLQKRFYEEVLGAEHIGIDLSIQYSTPDICGNLRDPATVEELKRRLHDRPINLLFMDAETNLLGIELEWTIYGSLTQHLVAVHNIFSLDTYPTGAKQFWTKLVGTRYRDYRFMTFYEWLPPDHPCFRYQMGLGVVVKER